MWTSCLAYSFSQWRESVCFPSSSFAYDVLSCEVAGASKQAVLPSTDCTSNLEVYGRWNCFCSCLKLIMHVNTGVLQFRRCWKPCVVLFVYSCLAWGRERIILLMLNILLSQKHLCSRVCGTCAFVLSVYVQTVHLKQLCLLAEQPSSILAECTW